MANAPTHKPLYDRPIDPNEPLKVGEAAALLMAASQDAYKTIPHVPRQTSKRARDFVRARQNHLSLAAVPTAPRPVLGATRFFSHNAALRNPTINRAYNPMATGLLLAASSGVGAARIYSPQLGALDLIRLRADALARRHKARQVMGTLAQRFRAHSEDMRDGTPDGTALIRARGRFPHLSRALTATL